MCNIQTEPGSSRSWTVREGAVTEEQRAAQIERGWGRNRFDSCQSRGGGWQSGRMTPGGASTRKWFKNAPGDDGALSNGACQSDYSLLWVWSLVCNSVWGEQRATVSLGKFTLGNVQTHFRHGGNIAEDVLTSPGRRCGLSRWRRVLCDARCL